ncbi:lytic transglycosylase domain-containing protein [bacterium]|nr:lytic transglycosylase domain-containing protein [bacterium]
MRKIYQNALRFFSPQFLNAGFSLFALAGCAHSVDKKAAVDLSPTQFKTAASLATKNYALSDRLIRELPESLARAEDFETSMLGVRVIKMSGRSPTPTDLQSIVSLRALLVGERELRDSRPAQAAELAKVVLTTEFLPTELYVSALRLMALADVVKLSGAVENAPATTTARDPKFEFNALQNLQCAKACKTAGWETIAREDPSLLSLNGYRIRLLSESHFKRLGLNSPSWLKAMWSSSQSTQRKETATDGEFAKNDSALARIQKLKGLLDGRQWTQASQLSRKIISEYKQERTNQRRKKKCSADLIYAQYTAAQSSRIAQDRKSFAQLQGELIANLDQSSCAPEEFGIDKEQFDSFRLDARLWLARLQWEQNDNPLAFYTARKALSEAAALQSWEHYVDAAKILIGRVGFEMLNPTENLAFLSALEHAGQGSDSEEFPVWINSRRGLLQFLDGDFEGSKKSFERVIEQTEDNFTRSMAFYWMGRTTQASRDMTSSENSFLSSGRTDPLSIYDIFSGQLLARESGRASTQAKRAFLNDWRKIHQIWLNIDSDKPLQIVSSVPPRTLTSTKLASDSQDLTKSQKQFDTSLESSILFVTLLRALEPEQSTDEFTQLLKNNDELVPSIVRAEAATLRTSFARLNTLHADVLPRAHQVAWLTHALGDHANAMTFVGRLRDSLGWDTDYLPFLYFIFYPRPYEREYQQAAARCSVDIDVLYAVSRQESLFQPSVKSPVGAVGLMQLLPSTANRVLRQLPEFKDAQKIDLTNPSTNTLAGACYLRDLLNRYQKNLAFAVAAYNAGEQAVDKWVERRHKLADIPYFIEFIPLAETKTYVQRVLRNYYNIKWIYQDAQDE